VTGLTDALEALLDDGARRKQVVTHNLDAMRRVGPSQTVDAYLAQFAGREMRPVGSRAVSSSTLTHALERSG
jgi:hypothetical protein